MPTQTTHLISTTGMTCQHCAKAVTRAIQDKDPNALVSVDLKTGQVSVISSVERQVIVQSITEEGFGTK